ncbi:MAG: hypothetical protein DWI21_15495 [Planctomycetota bacterium]|nr:MAG: hypothetical protein DWI21_15495 [Planctomycetota bacterium]
MERTMSFQWISQKLRLDHERFHLTTVCRSPVFENLKYGTSHGIRFAIFDYQFVLPKFGTFCQTVVWLHWRGANLPDFAIGPGSWLGQDLFDLLTGRNDFHFESHPTFSKNHQIRGGNVSAIRELFTEDVLNFYEQHSGLGTEVSGNRLLYYRVKVRVEPDDIQPFLNEALQLLALFQPANHEGSA